MLGWHFVQNDKRLGYGDRRHVRVGRILKVDGPPKLCCRGLHASRRAIDALNYSVGHAICRVELGGRIIHEDDKSVGTERTVLWWLDSRLFLHEFVCRVATIAMRKEGFKGKRSWAAINVKRRWLRGEATTDELENARYAAEDATRSCGYDARDLAYAAAKLDAFEGGRMAAVAIQDQKNREKRQFNRILTGMVCAAHRKGTS